METSKNLTGQILSSGRTVIARGGFSTIRVVTWRPRGTSDDFRVVLKSLSVSGNIDRNSAEGKLLKRLHREVRVWSQLRHQCIVPLLGYVEGSQDDGPGLVSPLYSRGNVLRFLSNHQQINTEILCLDIAMGLEYLHSHDPPVIHGDIKGENVLINSEGRACLCDFGLSIMLDGMPTQFTSSTFAGSIRFLAPELLDSSSKTIETDVYAFGCTSAQLMLGAEPFQKFTQETQVLRVIGRQPPYDVNEDEKRMIFPSQILMDCWNSDPMLRPKVSGLIDALRSSLVSQHEQNTLLRYKIGNRLSLTSTDGESVTGVLVGVARDETSFSVSIDDLDTSPSSCSSHELRALKYPVGNVLRVPLYQRLLWRWKILTNSSDSGSTSPGRDHPLNRPGLLSKTASTGPSEVPKGRSRNYLEITRSPSYHPPLRTSVSAADSLSLSPSTVSKFSMPSRKQDLLEDDWESISARFRAPAPQGTHHSETRLYAFLERDKAEAEIERVMDSLRSMFTSRAAIHGKDENSTTPAGSSSCESDAAFHHSFASRRHLSPARPSDIHAVPRMPDLEISGSASGPSWPPSELVTPSSGLNIRPIPAHHGSKVLDLHSNTKPLAISRDWRPRYDKLGVSADQAQYLTELDEVLSPGQPSYSYMGQAGLGVATIRSSGTSGFVSPSDWETPGLHSARRLEQYLEEEEEEDDW